ncbi:DNA-binding response regulator [Dyella monticola]|uniref:DNA-binding response regulator n=1 Tax=Dyella monticola TaxID=1927958 RepID=A0A370WTK3_9GAMM|nr:response regulator transcription factor [Dyella monticola]RDS79488.1 DNA-binding response regulator [Dyella monticola]
MVEGVKGNVLIVEDDAQLRDEVLVPGLKACGFNAWGVGSATELYRSIVVERFRLVVLDITLPDEDGFELVGHLRALSDIGIVVLSEIDSTAHRVRGLIEGADVYLTKPVDVDVLAASLHSLSRRVGNAAAMELASTGWRLEASGWRLVAPGGVAIALSLPERLLLNRLTASMPEPTTRSVLLEELSTVVPGFDPARLEMLIHRLRQKVARKAKATLPLIAVRGVGYTLALD